MNYEEVIKFLAEHLRLETKTTSNYTGGDPLYEDVTTVQLLLCGEVISEVDV